MSDSLKPEPEQDSLAPVREQDSLLPAYEQDQLAADSLDRLATDWGTVRRWSPVQTNETPIEDTLRGGYCESDEQLRRRVREGLE